jgi:uncharacterized protein with ParB-like and HNH nuclease domain
MLKSGNSVPVKNLLEYFTQDQLLRLPPWQREYSWIADNEGQIGQLLLDLKTFVENEDQNEYLLGSVILCDSDEQNTYLIIDGQQRTVTLSLLLFVLNKYLVKNNLYKLGIQSHSHLQSDILKCLSLSKDNFSPRVLFNQKQANDILLDIRDWSNSVGESADQVLKTVESQSKTQKNLLEAVNYIQYRIAEEKEKWIDDDKLVDALLKILNKVKVLQLNLDKQSEAISIFDRINNRGLPLNNSDLIKNQIFQKVSDSDFDEISSNWLDTSAFLASSKLPRLAEVQYLLRAFAWTLEPRKTSYDQLFDFYAGNTNSYLDSNSPLKFSEELMYLAEDLINYSNGKHKKHECDQLGELQFPQFLGSVQHFPVLLAARNIKNLESFKHLVHQVSMRTSFYVLAQERPPVFESMIPIWSNKIREAGESLTVEDLNAIYNDERIKPDDNLIAQLDKNIDDWDIENAVHKKKIRAALGYLCLYFNLTWDSKPSEWGASEYFRTRRKKGEKKGWDIDHIYPTNLIESNSKEEKKLNNSLGNLVLLSPSDNRSQKDAPPIAKKANYHGSHLLLTKSLVLGNLELSHSDQKAIDKIESKFGVKSDWNIENWNVDSITARHAYYKKILKDLLTLKIQ